MARTVRYHPKFDVDVIEAAEWYAKRQRAIAIEFTIRVEVAV